MTSPPSYRLLILLVCLPRLVWSQAALSDQYRQRAETLYIRAQHDRATFWYEKAYQLVQHTDPVRAANLCVDLSSMDYMKNHSRAATDRCLLGLRYINALNASPDSVRFKLYSSLGTYYKALYQKDSALIFFRKADALLNRNSRIEQQIPIYVLYHFNNQGSWFFKLGNYSRSLLYLGKAHDVAVKHNLPDEIGYVESNLAGCYEKMGDLNKSLHHRKKANQLYHKKDTQKVKNLSGIGWTLYKLNRIHEALIYFHKADDLMRTFRQGRQSADYASDQIHLWRMMSSCYRVANQWTKAKQCIKQAFEWHKRHLGGWGPLLAEVLVEMGHLDEAQHKPKQAIDNYQGAIRAVCRDTNHLTEYWQNPTLKTVTDEPTLLLAAVTKAAALKKFYEVTRNKTYLKASIAAYRFSVKLQQRIRHGIVTEQSHLVFSIQQHALVPEAIAVAYKAYEQQRDSSLCETLFQLFEQAQAGSLREALRLNEIKPQTIPRPLLEREQRLKKRIREISKRSVNDSIARIELTQCQLQWHQLLETFQQDYPAYYQLHFQDSTISSPILQQKLDAQTAYVAYVRHEAALFILVVTRQSIDIVRQPINPIHFEQQLNKLKQQLYVDPVLAQYEGALYSSELYAACIEPIWARLVGKTRLIISRDWSFNFLPFEILETGRQSQDYLFHHFTIAYAFSAQSFFDAPQRPVSKLPVLVIAPFARADAVQKTVNRQDGWQTLASSETEARTIGGDLLTGPKASLSNFLKTDLTRNVIYFATHAAADDADPTNSRIAFYPGEPDKLYTDDIYNMSLSATGLVVLGACETGSGRTMKGEGVLSLARAFAYAGCPSVVTTLWKANDETTSFLTVRLHHYLAQGMPIDYALQQARLDFFESPLKAKYNHPYYWANYTLLGKYDPVMPKSILSHSMWWVVIGLTGIAIFWQRKRFIRW